MTLPTAPAVARSTMSQLYLRVPQRTGAFASTSRCFSSICNLGPTSATASNQSGSMTIQSCRADGRSQQRTWAMSTIPMTMRMTNAAKSNLAISQMAQRAFSTKEESTGVSGWMERRKNRKEQEQYMEQMNRLSEMDEFKLTDFKDELNKSLTGVMANVSFLQTKEIKAAKDIVTCVESMVKVLGQDAVADDLLHMDRLQRLKIADGSDRTVEEIGYVVSQIQNMDIMQKTLRRRRLQGKPIPESQSKMQEVMKKEAMATMSPAQKEMVRKKQMDMAKHMQRRR
uniref:Signal recognition particle SRP54 subunit M-domain domain-containing protein n=1 Tax=Craspedostauros australis TaxID=1486917 RepID=A0A7S0F573_9STRA|mmetsp:Transcript_6520/g.17724  ORF Transcript_6520/g.17724 Transcript_6520/m.17724 type:complete len:284 (+) Transcript_6520:125-976(+)